MNSRPLARGSQEVGFMQPRDHSFAQPCKCNQTNYTSPNPNSSRNLVLEILRGTTVLVFREKREASQHDLFRLPQGTTSAGRTTMFFLCTRLSGANRYLSTHITFVYSNLECCYYVRTTHSPMGSSLISSLLYLQQ